MALFQKNPEIESDEDGITFLSIGTRILAKDGMDQYIRTLGSHRTHYAATAQMAMRILVQDEIEPDVVLLENELSDSTAFRLLKEIRESGTCDGTYFIFAVDDLSPALHHLSQELDVQGVLVKPFTANDLKAQIVDYEKYMEKEEEVRRILQQAKVYFRDKRTNEAHSLYRKAVELYPNDVSVHSALGEFHLVRHELERAEEYFKQALEIDSTFVPALNGRGMVAYRQKNYKIAYLCLSKAQELSPLNTDRAVRIAKLHLSWASQELATALRLDPTNQDLRLEYGKHLLFQNDHAGAVRELTQVSSPSRKKEIEALMQFASGPKPHRG